MRRISISLMAGPALALSAGAMAQQAPSAPIDALQEGEAAVELTPEQQAAYDGWPADLQAQYEAWPGDAKAYFWSLSPERQQVFWRLNDNDKLALVAMSAPDREAMWQLIERRVAAEKAAPPTDAEPSE